MINRLKNNSQLLKFSILNILDKGFIFIIPLIILFVVKDKELYNKIEYIYAVANILIIFMGITMKNYIFYSYKNANNKVKILKENRTYISFLIYFYILLAVFFYALNYFFNFSNEFYLYLFIWIRAIYILVIGVFSYYYRLINQPSKIYFYSLLVSICSILLLTILLINNIKINLFYIFLFQIVLIFYYGYKGKRLIKIFTYNKFYDYVKKNISYSYPIIINLIIITLMNQLGKIYVYNFLSTEDMTIFSFIQRITLSLFMIHVSIFGYYSKQIFISDCKQEQKKLFNKYISIMLFFTFLLYIAGYIYSLYNTEFKSIYFTLSLLANLTAAVASYFESYFNKFNKNIYIPLISTCSILIYILILAFYQINLYILFIALFISNTFLLLMYLYIFNIKIRKLFNN